MEDHEARLLELEKEARVISDLQDALDSAFTQFGWESMIDWLQEELSERAEEEHPSDQGLSCDISFTAY